MGYLPLKHDLQDTSSHRLEMYVQFAGNDYKHEVFSLLWVLWQARKGRRFLRIAPPREGKPKSFPCCTRTW